MKRQRSLSFLHTASFASSPINFFLLLNLFSLVSAQNSTKNICQTKECLSAAQNLKESINFKADPCDDFYKYACGNWPNVHQNPSWMPENTITLRTAENTAELHDFLKLNNSQDEPEAVHKSRQFYALCLNNTAYSNKLEPIETILREIGLPAVVSLLGYDEINNYDYTTALAKAAKLAGIKMFFDLTTSFNPYNGTLNVIYLKKKGPMSELLDSSTLTSSRSKRAVGQFDQYYNNQNQFMAQVIRRMCEDSTSTSCKHWNSTYSFVRDIIIQKILTQRSEIEQINLMPFSMLNSTPVVIYSLKQLQDLTDSIAIEVNTTIPKLNWTRYIEETFTGLDVQMDLTDPRRVQIGIENLNTIKTMIRYIYKIENVKLLVVGLWWEVVSDLLPYVDFNIFEKKYEINNIEAREKRCAELTKLSFGLAISYTYATKEKYINAKTNIRKMYDHIRDSFKQIIQQVPWMDETTRQRALNKLQLVKPYIVYPDGIKSTNLLNEYYQNTKITDNFYDTAITIIQNRVKNISSTLNQMNDFSNAEWILIPTIVNAFYAPELNSIVIPAGIIGLSIYNNSLRALDYGGIGSIVGHELTHAFDNTGRRFNEIGNLENWWQPETLNSYREKAKCFVNTYANYSTDFGGSSQKVDSKLSLREDISDNGGFKESLFAYRKSISELGEEPILPQFENFTHEQLLTLAFANVWCENPNIYSWYMSYFKFHSPNAVRVNGVLQNSKEFAEIWKCPKGSNMNPNSDKCSVW
ncbi:neprilysin-11-like [Planococcus citri]|uniref:neprilysin-11-like n=1 Tax=Planococcus citri TaxID=170843 RepID=UPI0031F7F7BF